MNSPLQLFLPFSHKSEQRCFVVALKRSRMPFECNKWHSVGIFCKVVDYNCIRILYKAENPEEVICRFCFLKAYVIQAVVGGTGCFFLTNLWKAWCWYGLIYFFPLDTVRRSQYSFSVPGLFYWKVLNNTCETMQTRFNCTWCSALKNKWNVGGWAEQKGKVVDSWTLLK